MKIYTKTGDQGDTGLFGGARVSKASDRVQAYGQVDELNSVLGWSACAITYGSESLEFLLRTIQTELFVLGAELATKPGKEDKLGIMPIGPHAIDALEGHIDNYETDLEPLKNFILPGGSELAARFHIARSVCRRAERAVVSLSADSPVRNELIVYLNRLSDLLFVLARHANHTHGVHDVPWTPK